MKVSSLQTSQETPAQTPGPAKTTGVLPVAPHPDRAPAYGVPGQRRGQLSAEWPRQQPECEEV